MTASVFFWRFLSSSMVSRYSTIFCTFRPYSLIAKWFLVVLYSIINLSLRALLAKIRKICVLIDKEVKPFFKMELLFGRNIDASVHRFFKRNNGFCTFDSINFLQLIMQ